MKSSKIRGDAYFTQGTKFHLRFSFGITSGTSGGAFTEFACLYGINFTEIPFSVELPLLGYLSALGMLSAQAKDLSLLCSEEGTEFLDIEQKLLTVPVKCGGGNFTGRLCGSHFSHVVLLLLIWLQKPYPLPIARCSNLRPPECRFLNEWTVCILPKFLKRICPRLD